MQSLCLWQNLRINTTDDIEFLVVSDEKHINKSKPARFFNEQVCFLVEWVFLYFAMVV